MKSNLKKLIDLDYVSKIQKMDFVRTGFHYQMNVKPEKILEFVTIIKEKDFNLNLITGFDEYFFKLIYIFSSISKNIKIKVEVEFNNEKINSIESVFNNAEHYESDVNEKYGLIFDEKYEIKNNDIDDFMLSSNAFENIGTEPFFFDLLTCGQIVKDILPEKGFHSRFLENSAKSDDWMTFLVKSSRLDSFSGFFSNHCFCGVIEKALDINVPQRAEIIRIIISELSRISFNLNQISLLLKYLGLNAQCSFFEILEENVLDIIEYVAGKRLTEFFKVGGVSKDIGKDFQTLFHNKTKNLLKDLDEIRNNGFVCLKLKGFCLITKDQAHRFGMTGHHLRSTGEPLDIRKNESYGLYDLFDFKPTIRTSGDGLDRLHLKVDEIFISYKIIIKAIKIIENGPYLNNNNNYEIPYGDYFYSVESPRGRLSYYLKGNNSSIPFEVKIETPSIPGFCYFKNLKGISLSDLPLHIFNLCFSMAEVDK